MLVVDMVLQGFISGEAYIVGEQPEDLAVLDEDVRGNAKCAEDELLTTLTQVVEAALPELFGADGENPVWCDNPGPRPGQQVADASPLEPLFTHRPANAARCAGSSSTAERAGLAL